MSIGGREVRHWIGEGFDSFEGTISAQVHSFLEDGQGLVWVGLKQAGGAQQSLFDLRDVYRRKLNGSKLSTCIRETPGNMANTADSGSISKETTKAACSRYGLDGSDKVVAVEAHTDACSGVPDDG